MSEEILLSIIGGVLLFFLGLLAFMIRSWTNEAKEEALKARSEARDVAEKAQTAIREFSSDLKETLRVLFKKIDRSSEKEAACQAELPRTYATKLELTAVEVKVDSVGKEVAALGATLKERANDR